MLTQAMSEDLSQLVHFEASGKPDGSRVPSDVRRLFGFDAEALAALMVEAGEPAWRGRQLAEALYRQRVTELDAITTLPKALRQRLVAEGWQVGRPADRPGLPIRGWNGALPGRVRGRRWPDRRDGLDAGGRRRRIRRRERKQDDRLLRQLAKRWHQATICVSSQVGCAVNCQFCLTAKLGLQRNLTAGEIAGQVVAVFDRHGVEVGRDRVNLVFMGMGEPFLNYDNFMGAVRLLVREVGLSPRRMTVSTSGIVPGIERFAQEPPEFRPKLAISLNAPNDAIRGEIMPINRKWPIAAVMDAVRQVQLRPRERITFEYVLLGGVTDQPKHAAEVARLIRRTGLPAKVNLIAWNPGPGIAYATPQAEAVEAFRSTLTDAGIPAYLRKPRGRDIYAACGQLKRTVEG